MARKKHLINVHTSTGTTAPTGASLYLGEIAVQHTTDDPALWIKVGSAETSTVYEKFIGKTEITNIVNESKILGSGYTYTGIPYVNSATSIADAYSAITKELISDGKVTAAALNDLNDRVNALSGVDINSVISEYVAPLSGVVEENELVTAAALNDLNNRMLTGVSVNGVSAQVVSNVAELDIPTPEMILGSGYTYTGISYVNSATSIADAYSALTNEVINDERVASAALNDLDERLKVISGDVADIAIDTEELSDFVHDNKEVVAGALNDLNERVSVVETHMTGDYIPLEGYVLASGKTEEELLVTEDDTVNEAFGKLQKQIIDDEIAVAGGLNDLNSRIIANADAIERNAEAIAENTGVTILSAAVVSLSAETNGIDNRVNYIQNNYTSQSDTNALSASVMSISAKTNGILTLNLNGVLQGRYSPSANTTIKLEAIPEITGADVLLTGYQLATGTTEEELVIVATDTVNEAFGKIQKQNYDNEAVIAGSLNDLDERIIALENNSAVTQDINALSATVISDERVTASALNNLNDRIDSLSGAVGDIDMEPLSAAVITNSRITAAALNDLNARLVAVSGDVTDLSSLSASIVANEENIQALSAAVIDDEYVISAAFNEMNSRISTVSGNTDMLTSDVGALSGAVQSLSAAVVTISGNSGGGGGGTDVGPLSAAVISLSAATTAHTGDSNIHVTSAQKTNWTNSGTSGANAYVGYIAHSANTGIHVTTSDKSTWNGKQDAISDLATIRNNASSGKSAYDGYIAHSANTDSHVTSAQKTNWTNSGTSGANAYVGYIAHSANTDIHVTTSDKNTWNGKQNAISDLETIRNNASSGATAYSNVNSLSAATTAMSANVAKIAVTGVTVDGTGNAITGATYSSSALTLSKGNVLTAETLTGVSAGGTNLTVTNKVAAIPSASSNTFGVVKTGDFLTNSNGTISVTTGTGSTNVARGDHSHAGYATTGTMGTHSATTITSRTSSQMHLPTVTSSDNGKILIVKNGAWSLETPVTVYTGSGDPQQNQGNDGDIYLQTS